MDKPTETRIDSVDALRGFALFGILIVNIFVFNISYQYFVEYYSQFSGADKTIDLLVVELFAGKFMFLFAFLFGLSCWLQFNKKSSIIAFRPYWIRRVLLLAVFGIVHLLLFWSGDILLPYALLGFTLLFFIEKPLSVLIPVSLILLFFPAIAFALQALIAPLPAMTNVHHGMPHYIEVFSQAGFAEVFSLRMHEYLSFSNEKLLFYIPKELALFLAGIIAGKTELLNSLNRRPKSYWIVSLIILMLLITRLFVKHTFPSFNPAAENQLVNLIPISIHITTETLQGVLYILLFLLLWQLWFFQRWLSLFRYPGKMALSNYFFQSAVCVLIFYSYGFGYYGQLAPIQLVIIASGIFLVQSLLSKLWLSYYTQGPLEMIWKKYSYRKSYFPRKI
jgi:uncharacterized protein